MKNKLEKLINDNSKTVERFFMSGDEKIFCIPTQTAIEALYEQRVSILGSIMELHRNVCPNRTIKNICLVAIGYKDKCDCQCGYMKTFENKLNEL